jgi:HEAT repeat protein
MVNEHNKVKIIDKHLGTQITNEIGQFLAGGYQTYFNGEILYHLLLYKKLKNPTPVRIQSGCLMGDIFGDKNYDVRMRAARALEMIGKPAAEHLTKALKDKDSWVRMYAAGALRKIGDGRAVGPLIEVLKDEDKDVRRYAAWALGNIRDKRAAGPLTKALKDEDIFVRVTAAWALRRIKGKRAVEPPQ